MYTEKLCTLMTCDAFYRKEETFTGRLTAAELPSLYRNDTLNSVVFGWCELDTERSVLFFFDAGFDIWVIGLPKKSTGG